MKIHELLGIDEHVPEDVLIRAYRFNCPHPDRGGDAKDFGIWNQAFQEWEASLVEETRLQQYIRELTRQAMIKSYKTEFTVDYLVYMQGIVIDAIRSCQANISSILEQEKSFKEGIISASKFKSEDIRKIVISELEKQLKSVPDLLEFQKSDLAFYKEVQKEIQLDRTPTSSPRKVVYLGHT